MFWVRGSVLDSKYCCHKKPCWLFSVSQTLVTALISIFFFSDYLLCKIVSLTCCLNSITVLPVLRAPLTRKLNNLPYSDSSLCLAMIYHILPFFSLPVLNLCHGIVSASRPMALPFSIFVWPEAFYLRDLFIVHVKWMCKICWFMNKPSNRRHMEFIGMEFGCHHPHPHPFLQVILLAWANRSCGK